MDGPFVTVIYVFFFAPCRCLERLSVDWRPSVLDRDGSFVSSGVPLTAEIPSSPKVELCATTSLRYFLGTHYCRSPFFFFWHLILGGRAEDSSSFVSPSTSWTSSCSLPRKLAFYSNARSGGIYETLCNKISLWKVTLVFPEHIHVRNYLIRLYWHS